MNHKDPRTLINMGRKAGLRTSEIYRAMANQQQRVDSRTGQTDGNGFAGQYNQTGKIVYRPITR
ncbi:MAG: hypothetical protein ACFCD0_06105 [Gemmataceae bacterium]